MAIWPVGDWFAIPVGGLIYSYLTFVALYNFIEIFENYGTWGDWFMGPFRRAFVGEFIFGMGLFWGNFPLLGILTSWGCLIWAKMDYYDYLGLPTYLEE